MATAAPPTIREHVRDASGFGGIVPTGAVTRGGETLVAVLALEHHPTGAVLPLLVLSEAPGLLEWDPVKGLSVTDDRGGRYTTHVLTSASGLGQFAATVWIEPALPSDVRLLEVVVEGLERVNPTRGGGRGVTRPLTGGPWPVVVDLVPERTVAEVPERPAEGPLPGQAGSVPIRAHGMFVDVIPAGQARIRGGIAVCVSGVERYWDRAVATLVALGPAGDEANAPSIGRARVDVWDARGHRYRVTPVQGASRGEWSEVAVEIVPAIPPDAAVLAISVSQVPLGADSGRRDDVPGPFIFGIQLPAE
jgi:hypothetical protein